MVDRKHRPRLTGAEKLARDIEITRKARNGWTNAEIGKHFDLHPGTVSRIIQNEIRQRHAAHAGGTAAIAASLKLERFTKQSQPPKETALPASPHSDAFQNSLTLKLDIPWDDAPVLLKHARKIVQVLERTLEQRTNIQAEREANRRAAALQTEHRKRAYLTLAIVARNEIRHRQSRRGSNQPVHLIAETVAAQYGLSAQSLQGIIRQYHGDLKDKARRNRDAKVIHLYFAGYADSAIAKRVGLSVGTVARIRRREKDLIAAIRRQSIGLDPSGERQP